jgi:hypothetical protein
LDPNRSDGYGGRERYSSNINIELLTESMENFINFSDEVALMAADPGNFMDLS